MTTEKKKVFVVEDDPAYQKMLEHHFEQLGNYDVSTFADPDAMMGALEQKPFAIVLDHYFPNGKTGLEYLETIRKKHKSIPVIYYTTASDEKVRQQAVKAGVQEYIVKNEASLVRLRTALDQIEANKGKGFFSKLFGR